MPNAYHHAEDKGLARPNLRPTPGKLGLANQSWKIPKTPGGPRKVHTVRGRAVKVYRQGDVTGA
jgi:hypothetical protein